MANSKPDPKTQIVPFGKYKGQPLAVLLEDKEYSNWLTTQEWVRQQYTYVYMFICHGSAEFSETPEHNLFQIKFSKDDFCRRFIQAALSPRKHLTRLVDERITELKKDWLAKLENECDTARRRCQTKESYAKHYQKLIAEGSTAPEHQAKAIKYEDEALEELNKIIDLEAEMKDPAPAAGLDRLRVLPRSQIYREFEVKGWDVYLRITWQSKDLGLELQHACYIEVKPWMGDDYPGILRQMKINSNRVGGIHPKSESAFLLIGGYSGPVPLEDVRQFFLASDFKLMLFSQIQGE